MATTPRAGIINLNFKDVSEMAKNIADNDPWKTGIDAVGKVLTDRERYIMYQRALADAEKRERPEDKTIGDLISGAGKKIGEGASWLKDKWDRLDIRSPFEETLTEGTKTESPITETASEKGSREIIGYKPNQSPIETDKYRTNLKAPERANVEPNDELSFGFNQDVGQGEEKASPIIPFATGEQAPEQIGVKVDYGTSEPTWKLRSPFAMRTAEETKAQESTSPFGNTEVADTKIKAPRMSEMEAWSEMYRLKPEQAKFDYTRIQNAEVLAQKAQELAIKAKDKSTATEELQQLWKDNQRALTEARKNQDATAIKMYEDNIARLTPILQERNPEIWGTPKTKNAGAVEDTDQEKTNTNKDAAIAEATTAIYGLVDVKENKGAGNGVPDNRGAIKQKLATIRDKYGITDLDMKDTYDLLDTESQRIADDYKAKLEKEEEARIESRETREESRQNKQDRIAQDKEYKPMWSSIQLLKANPNDKTQKRATLNIALRVESGAAIAASEFDKLMSQTLPPDKYEQFKSETTGLATYLASLVSDTAMEEYLASVAEKYLGDVDSTKLYDYVDAKIPDDYYKRSKGTPSSGTGKSAGGNKGGKFAKYGKK